MKTLFLAWQDPENRNGLTVGRLTFENGEYKFVYTAGAHSSKKFRPFERMDDLYSSYVSKELFPLFANRILTKSRPEYSDFIKWLNITNENADTEFEMLALTGGTRGTDSLEVFPCPEPDITGKYHVKFFSHGLRHLPNESCERVKNLSIGDKLFAMLDVQNPFDSFALVLRTGDPATIVGFAPRYLAQDFHAYLKNNPGLVEFNVSKVNPDAPAQMRLMCVMKAPWLSDYKPCSSEQYNPLSEVNTCPTR